MTRVAPLLLLAALACAPDEDLPNPECDAEGGVFVEPSASVSTVAEVKWTGRSDVRTRIEVVDRHGPVLATEWRGEGAQSSSLVGVPANSSVTADLVTEDGESLTSCRFTTAPLPGELTALTLDGTPTWDGLLATSFIGSGSASVVIDEEGAIRWYSLTEPGLVYRTRFRADGGGVHYLYERDAAQAEDSWIGAADWGSTDVTRLTGDEHPTHDFEVLGDGTIGYITSYILGDPENKALGNSLYELPPGGTPVELWSAQDDYFPSEDIHEDPSKNSTHANALHYEAERDAWWFGMRDVAAIAVVSRDTTETLEVLGGRYSDYQFGPDASFQAQHGFQFLDDGLVLHDNRESADQTSRVLTLTVDRDTKRAEFVSELQHEPPVYVYALGEPVRFDDGSTLVVWSTSGLVDEFDADGTLVASLSAPLGSAIGYIEYHASFPGQVELR